MCTGVSIEQWRASIGTMAALSHKRRIQVVKGGGGASKSSRGLSGQSKDKSQGSSKLSGGGRGMGRGCGLGGARLLLVLRFLLVLAPLLLLTCGDVERNPGPTRPLSLNAELTEGNLTYLMIVLDPVAYKCELFALQIGVPFHTVERIKRENNDPLKEQLQIFLSFRLSQSQPFTLQDIVTALQSPSVSEASLARAIESSYTANQTTTSTSTFPLLVSQNNTTRKRSQYTANLTTTSEADPPPPSPPGSQYTANQTTPTNHTSSGVTANTHPTSLDNPNSANTVDTTQTNPVHDAHTTLIHKAFVKALKPYRKHASKCDTPPLGEGSYGSVYEFIMDENGRQVQVAGKIYRLHNPENISSYVDQFTRTFAILFKLKHDNIVRYLGVCYQQHNYFPILLMERCQCNLMTYLRRNPGLNVSLKLCILRDVANGLKYLHEQEPAIIHRDLTASNILLDRNQTAKIADFGTAKIMDLTPGAPHMTMTAMQGTPFYLPPEASGTKYDDKYDIFSFGHLSLVIITQEPVTSLPPNIKLDLGTREAIVVSEIERRQEHFEKAQRLLGPDHFMIELIRNCLQIFPQERPSAKELVGVIDNKVIGLNQLPDVCHYLINLERQHLKTLGLLLGLDHSTVMDTYEYPRLRDYREAIIKAWINEQDNVAGTGKPSWRILADSLRHSSLKQNGIADAIVKNKDILPRTVTPQPLPAIPQLPTGHHLGYRDLDKLLTALKEVAYAWKDIGLGLGYLDGQLRNIQETLANFGNPEYCLRDLLSQWLRTGDATVETLADTLREKELGEAALKVEKAFGIDEIVTREGSYPRMFTPQQSVFGYAPINTHHHHATQRLRSPIRKGKRRRIY